MSALYQLEHKVLPGMIFSNKEGERISPFMLGNLFSKICMDYLRYALGVKDKNEDIGYTEADFTAEPIVVKDNGEPVYYITRLRFPFKEDMYHSTLCPRIYLVHGLQGENPRYYTIEYDQTGFKGPGSYWLCRWSPTENGRLVHGNMGKINLHEQDELRKLVDINNKYFRV